MSTLEFALGRVAELESILAQRDRDDADRAAAAAAKQVAAAQDEQQQRETEQRIEAVEQARRGAWLSHNIASALPGQPMNVAEILASVPKDSWPPGVSEADVLLQSTPQDSSRETAMHKLLRRSK